MTKDGTPGWKNKMTRMILTIWLEQTNWTDQQPIRSQSNDQLESTKFDTPGWRLRVSRSLATKKNQSVVGGRRSVGFGVYNVMIDVEGPGEWNVEKWYMYAKITHAWISIIIIMSTPFAK